MKKKPRGVREGRPRLRKPARKIKYPRKRKNITKREARKAVRQLRRKPVKPLVKPKVKPKRVKLTRNLIATLIKESASIRMENEAGHMKIIKFKVTPAFVDEYIDRILIGVEKNIPLICEQVLSKGRKTLMIKEDNGINDVVSLFDTGKNTLAGLTTEEQVNLEKKSIKKGMEGP
jgi:hypothetical protein